MIRHVTIAISAIALFASALLGGCAANTVATPKIVVARAALTAANGASAGEARVVQHGTGLSLVVAASGLTPGHHGMHFHTTGKCEAPGFTTAGSHLNPLVRQHGTENPASSHMGDLPNLTVGADGKAAVQVPLGLAALGLAQALLDADGAAIIIHATADDYRTDPTGNSGGRIACGVFQR